MPIILLWLVTTVAADFEAWELGTIGSLYIDYTLTADGWTWRAEGND